MSVTVSQPKLVNREDAAAFLSLKPQTMAAWAMIGRGPPVVKLGRAVRYRLADLEAFINANTRGGDSA